MKSSILTNDIDNFANTLIDKIFTNLNCVKIGKIVNFYPQDKTADVEIINKIKVNEEIKSIALLLKCLVIGNKITLPIETGEQVIVLFNDYDLNAYFETGEAQIPYSERKHDLSDGIVICGLNSLVNAINYDNDNICLKYKSEIKVGENIKLQTDKNINLISEETEIKTISEGNIKIDNTGLIKIANSQQSLFNILSTFLNGLLNLKTGVDPTTATFVLDQNTAQLITTTITNLSLLLKG
jgi:hypothetical protein